MDDGTTMVMVTLGLFLGIPTLVGVGWFIGTWWSRVNDHRRALNEIEQEKQWKLAQLDIELRDWQQRSSLEDLAKHRERLEKSLDGMHDDGDRP